MVKVGQRKFLKNHGYTDERLDKMSTSTARNIIAQYEKKAREKRISEERDVITSRKDVLKESLLSKGFSLEVLDMLEEYLRLE